MSEINDFERMLIADGTRLVKLFLHITPEEQIRRFRNRLSDPLKRWKLSYEDFRNRARWVDYEQAIEDMMQKTSTPHARWHLIPANDKPYGRIAALRIMVDRLSKGVSLDPRPLNPKVLEAAEKLLGIKVAGNGGPAKKAGRHENEALPADGGQARGVARPRRSAWSAFTPPGVRTG